jgi:hypothetical protein
MVVFPAARPFGSFTQTTVDELVLWAPLSIHAWSIVPVPDGPVLNSTLFQLGAISEEYCAVGTTSICWNDPDIDDEEVMLRGAEVIVIGGIVVVVDAVVVDAVVVDAVVVDAVVVAAVVVDGTVVVFAGSAAKVAEGITPLGG